MTGPAVRTRRRPSVLGRLVRGVLSVLGAVVLTLAFFLVLPLIQSISKPPAADLIVRTVDTTVVPPPPPPPPEEKKQEEEEPEKLPELAEDSPPLDLSQLELALNPGFSGDWVGGDFSVKLNAAAAAGDDVDALFSLSDLDQKPRVVHQPAPVLTRQVRQKSPGTVYVIFVVDQSGRVESPTVQQSSDPVLESAALSAVRQWRFEPGKRNGKLVRFRMRVPITFPKDSER